MVKKIYPTSELPIRKSVELLPKVFQTETNDKFLSGVVDPLIQPGVLQKTTGYIGRKFGKTFKGRDIYLDDNQTLRSRYQLEPAVIEKNHGNVEKFFDYLDFKNQLKFFGNTNERDDKITKQVHYTWNPPIDWDKFVNFREYYWQPEGPPSIAITGQTASVTSTYRVVTSGTANSYVFSPDSVTNNPTITLYRGQTYKFKINTPNQPFTIRTNFDTGSLLFVAGRAYLAGSLVVFDGKLWSAKVDISASDGSTITQDSQDWQFVENISVGSILDYNKGVSENGIESGTLTFTVPYDAPDILYYQSANNQDLFGRFVIGDIESNTFLNVEKDIVGKIVYTSSNGVTLSTGMILEFRGNVTPEKYSKDTWLVEGVGEKITLTRFADLTVPIISTDVPEVLFDNDGFDIQPFDDASAYPTYPDYITIRKDSRDRNAWSRYNRWFHRSVLEYSYKSRGQDFPAAETARAKRPIIEFKDDLQLHNHGAIAKTTVDYIDSFTTDAFSDIEGSLGYNVDGEPLFDGARLLITADTDGLVNNKIYQVQFITHNGIRQIHLAKPADSDSIEFETVLVERGSQNSGKMFWYTGNEWKLSQEKTALNQPPLFAAYDKNGILISGSETYPENTFSGSKIFSYKAGNSIVDPVLNFSLSYLNIDNVGDIEFEWTWETDSFQYTIDQQVYTQDLSSGYFKSNSRNQFLNGWTVYDDRFSQPIIDHQIISEATDTVIFSTVRWEELDKLSDYKIKFYLNGNVLSAEYTRTLGTFVFDQTFNVDDSLVIKIIADINPDQGYYELPLGLEKNPLNDSVNEFTLGQVMDHVASAIEFSDEFQGVFPGNGNLRDIIEYRSYSKRFLRHSSVAPLAVTLLCDKTQNIVKSLQYAKQSYTQFKNNFLSRALEIDYNDNTADFVDDILRSLTKIRNVNSPFYDSDMIGCGAFTRLQYTVEDEGIKVFALSEKFSLEELSRRAVYVYRNNQQLIHDRDYQFNSTFGFVQILLDLTEGDQIEIREYVTTSACFIPPTPTSMGLYKKYMPMRFIDDTYIDPKEVIQGHDGSITFTYGDYRDELILELELRIYNNIKKQYDENIFDLDSIVSGYYRSSDYSYQEQTEIVSQEFLKWVQGTNINYTLNTYFDSENSFTYTYSSMTDPTQTKNLLGYWRGVYKFFYDTDRPHRCPWEMLGFSEKPNWWDDQYGPAPYTSGNLLMWEDLRDGIIRQGARAGQYTKYKRSSLLNHLPVDGDGQLLSPLDAGLARDFALVRSSGPFNFGDLGPAEYAWRSSSEWPFAVVLSNILLKPFQYIGEFFDSSKIQKNELGQKVNLSNTFLRIEDYIVTEDLSELDTGLLKYVKSYIKSKNLNVDILSEKLSRINVALSSRLSGFVDKQQQKFLLDSKNPSSTTSSIFIPQENYDIIFNVSSPISSVTYSGVIVEKSAGGWVVNGYDDIQPYFSYYGAVPNQKDPLISVGGVSERFRNWSVETTYNNGEIVKYNNNYYRALRTHDSGSTFSSELWQKISELPVVGAVEAFRRRSFNTLTVKKLSYGTLLSSIQQVVDFLLGYEQFLISQGFIFDNYDAENKTSQDWLSSCKEFMFWTKHNWAEGSLLVISPSATKAQITIPVGVADNVLDGFYDYQVLKADGKPLGINFINVNRSFQYITVSTTNTTDGIYYLKLYYVLKEHVVVFDDRTVFNDIIYDKTSGYRQERIKSFGFRTVDWDGDYTSPGFLFDNVNIQPWQPYTDYKLGDIVAYKSYNWTSLVNQLGSEVFDETNWSKLDTEPEKQLVANFDYRINSMYDYFDVLSDGVSSNQRDLARHTIGYQTRDYLNNLSEDSVTQFLLYQGFIREKGTKNSITKIFDKLSRSGSDSIELKEEWAIVAGRTGGVDQVHEHELLISKNNFNLNPQPILIQYQKSSIVSDLYYRVIGSDFTITDPIFNKDVIPTIDEDTVSLTSGYVKADQFEHSVRTRNELLSLDISRINENDHIWVVFDGPSWSVLRINENPSLKLESINRSSTTTLVLTFNRPHLLEVDDIFAIRNLEKLTGFFKVASVVSQDSIQLSVAQTSVTPEIDDSSLISISLLTNCRFENYQELDPSQAALLKNNSKLFIDNNGSNKWEVVSKQNQFVSKSITDYGISFPVKTGSKVLYDNLNRHMIVSMPGSGYVMIYAEVGSGLSLKQVISAPAGYITAVSGTFGESLAISPDSKFLIIGSPLASGVPSTYRGEWDSGAVYGINDVVLYGGRLFKAISPSGPDLSTNIAVNNEDWELTTLVESYTGASGDQYYQQGMITVYEWSSGKYVLQKNLVSARPYDNEYFGHEIKIGVKNRIYHMAVSAPGAANDTGRVYLYKYENNQWQHLENTAYRGVYDFNESYAAGDIVWQAAEDPIREGVRGNLWTAVDDSTSDGSTITIESSGWLKVSDISTHSSLPTNIALEDDGSTLEFTLTGLLTEDQLAEQIKQGDKFGSSLAMSNDGSVLAIGAPYSDGQWFPNYRGVWRADVEYVEGEVVKFKDPTTTDPYVYYRLEDVSLGPDSVLRSYNERPDDSASWQVVSDSTTDPSGKIFIYKLTSYGSYELEQMINAGSISGFSDIESGLIVATGDQFGFSMDMDATGELLAVSSPRADINLQDQGSVYVFSNPDNVEYRLKQKLVSFEIYPSEYFGYGISVSPDKSRITIGAKNTPSRYPVYFDLFQETSFDQRRTTFVQDQGFTGGVYIFDKKDQTYFLTEKLQEELSAFESFGHSVDCVGNIVVVGSPDYRPPVIHNTGFQTFEGPTIGIARLYKKDNTKDSWNVIGQRSSLVNLELIKKLELYDNVLNYKIQDLDYVDPAKGKILNIAEQEISFKTYYDPAVYSIGTEDQIVDSQVPWLDKNVGKLWWDLSKAKWYYYEQGDLEYKKGYWGILAPHASIDVYEWVESVLLPSEWSILADTNEGLASGISGQPLHPDDSVYSKKELFNTTSGIVNRTLYYYWVRNKSTVPTNVVGRSRSAFEVASLILSPQDQAQTFLVLLDKDTLLTYNFENVIRSDTALINMEFYNNTDRKLPVHSEYQLLVEGDATSLPTISIENKWIDSLVGSDRAGNKVPDDRLSDKLKYGIKYRPRQTMFVDRLAALRITIDKANSDLNLEPFADVISFGNLNLVDPIPDEQLNLYDNTVDTLDDLLILGTSRLRQARIQVNIVEGEIDTIDILDSGFGYRVVPPIELIGDGANASAEAILDNQGRVIDVIITSRGKKYSSCVGTIRFFSVLVRSDRTINNFWSIYSWDNTRTTWFRKQTQAFDTTKYWSFVDWYSPGFSSASRVIKEISTVVDEEFLQTDIGDVIKIKEYGTGGWVLLEKVQQSGDSILDRYKIVGRQNGTIKISESLYKPLEFGQGFDVTSSYDINNYDLSASIELRNIITALKQDVYTANYAVKWNELFFAGIRYALSEQQYVDWIFKTSFLNAVHTVGSFEQKINYRNDNLESYKKYIEEVKPYRTTVREYVSKYDTVEPYGSAISDFDLPPAVQQGSVQPVENNNELLSRYPWKWWADNRGFSIVDIIVTDSGSDYISIPKVLIVGDGTGAEAQAYISNGRVTAVRVINSGSGYTKAPDIQLVGGTPAGVDSAKAVAVLGDGLFRTFDIKIKFDRISKQGFYIDFKKSQTFVATGITGVFDLNYAPTRDKTKITVSRQGEILFEDQYNLSLYFDSTNGFQLLKGRLILIQTPQQGDVINITYEINDELLESINRIEKYYSPTSGMRSEGKLTIDKGLRVAVENSTLLQLDSTFNLRAGMKLIVDDQVIGVITEVYSDFGVLVSRPLTLEKDTVITFEGYSVNQLMTGIDFGGVQIQGTTFDVTGGWDALPWFTDNWDNVEASSDYYVITDGSTNTVTLPYTPAPGQQITIYLKRTGVDTPFGIDTDGPVGSPNVVLTQSSTTTTINRIDDPNFNENWDSTSAVNPNAQMPTFVGDGSTRIIDIGSYIETIAGDTLIFRPIESDGAVTITDSNLLDTKISGGNLSALSSTGTNISPNAIDGIYASARGIAAEDISIDGGKFITPDQVPATEENIPGQFIDAFSIKVYTTTGTGASPLYSRILISDGSRTVYEIGQDILQQNSLLVYVDKIKKIYGLDYDVNFQHNTIEFVTAPSGNSIIEILSFGIGGAGLLDSQEFVADGQVVNFLTAANYVDTTQVYATVDGIEIDVGFIDATEIFGSSNEGAGKTLVQFATPPVTGSVIKLICLSVTSDTDSSGLSIVKINNQRFEYEGSTRSFDLDNFVELSRGSSRASMIVTVNGLALRGVDTTFLEYDGITRTFVLGTDPFETAGSILPDNIQVFINGQLKTFITDYVFDGISKTLTIVADLAIGDRIQIQNDLQAEYTISGNNLIIDSSVNLSSVDESDNDIVEVTWYSEYPTMRILTDEFSGGKVNYQLANRPLSIDYVWVFLNGVRLTRDQDYYIDLDRSIIYLRSNTVATDLIKIIIYSDAVYKNPSAFEIRKDVLNVYHYNRFSYKDTHLTKNLTYYDQQIEVADASNLTDPIPSRNIPGAVYIEGERIEYFVKSGNILSQIRRGTQGTSIKEVYTAETPVSDIGYDQQLPYNESQDRYDFYSDGSSVLVGPLDFVPRQNNRSSWTRTTIPDTHSACDEIEVFVAGVRLKKDPTIIFNPQLSAFSPEGDEIVEAEFSVDGISNYVRLTAPVRAGTRITVIKRTGKSWYDKGENTASAGVTLLDNTNSVAKFIAAKTSDLPGKSGAVGD
jgi:hypothetical protein